MLNGGLIDLDLSRLQAFELLGFAACLTGGRCVGSILIDESLAVVSASRSPWR